MEGAGGRVKGSTAQVAGAMLCKARKLTAHELSLLKKVAGATIPS